MKHIGVDVRLLFQTGVGTYLQNFLHYLPKYAPKNISFTLYCLPQDAQFVKDTVPDSSIRITTALWHSVNEQTTLLRLIQSDHLDLMHFTYFGHPLFYKGRCISTIHDVTPLLFATGKASTKNPLVYAIKKFVFSQTLQHQVHHSEVIITPSHTVKQQLIRLYGDSISDKILPLYEGVSYRLLSEQVDENIVKSPYLLYVGNFYPHKNVFTLIKAFIKSNSPYLLVLAGPHDYFLNRLLTNLSDEEKEHLVVKNKPTLRELVTLYKNAEALIHPSISEGFGLPLVEAMHFGIPIIASHIPVFQEILGNSYYSFDPYDENSISSAIQKFELSKEKKKNIPNGEFSFERMTQQTVDLYINHVS